MKKPVVDYRKFRLSKINDPEFSHLKLLLGWVVYFGLYLITENFIPIEKCHIIHSRLDDIIPFCEWFLIFYCLWYVFIFGSVLYFALYNIDSFKKFQIFLIILQLSAMAFYIIYPNRQDLRPTEFERDNFLTWLMGNIYAFDTSSNVCPSMHVAFSLAAMSVWLKQKVSPFVKAGVVILALLICASVVFVKQHSIIDVFVAIPFCLVVEIIVYGKSYWLKKIKRSSS
jgi:membrane-associated phospholipid phosphatase